MALRILIVDDEKDLLELLSIYLSEQYDCPIDVAENAKGAVKLLTENEYDIVVTDKNYPGLHGESEGGMDVLSVIQSKYHDTEAIMITGFATIDTAIDAMKLGAFDYIKKPFYPLELKEKIDRLLEYKSFIDSSNTIRVYKLFHNELISIIEKNTNLTLQEQEDAIIAIDEKIDYFFKSQKDYENIIFTQREALQRIAGLVSRLIENISSEDPNFNLIDQISIESAKRV